jgi:uncharacterized protein (DUF433 family)/ribosomal protein S20
MRKILSIASAGLALIAITGSAFAANNIATTTATASATPQAASTQHGQHFKQNGYQFKDQKLLSLLNIDAQTLKQELKAGKSLADIAAEKSVSEQQVIDLLVSEATQKLDQAVQSGKLTQDKADNIKANLADHIKKVVEQKGNFYEGKKKPGFEGGYIKDTATVLGITPQDILTQLKSGKSLVQIAQDKKVTEQQLVDALLQKDKDRLTKMVEKQWQPHQNVKDDASSTSNTQN